VATLSRALALALLLAGSGCISFARFDSPRTVRPGGREVLFAPSIYVGPRQDGNAFNTDLVLRWGVSDRVDMGLRFQLAGFGGDVKLQLVRAADPTRGVDLALAPSIGYGSDISWMGSRSGAQSNGAWQAALPLLFGINLGSYQLVLTPELLYEYIDVLPAGILNVGGTVAFGKMSGPGFSLYPVLAVWKALDPRQPLASLGGPGALVFQPALAFRWGR
jgi:hypothetical protein